MQYFTYGTSWNRYILASATRPDGEAYRKQRWIEPPSANNQAQGTGTLSSDMRPTGMKVITKRVTFDTPFTTEDWCRARPLSIGPFGDWARAAALTLPYLTNIESEGVCISQIFTGERVVDVQLNDHEQHSLRRLAKD